MEAGSLLPFGVAVCLLVVVTIFSAGTKILSIHTLTSSFARWKPMGKTTVNTLAHSDTPSDLIDAPANSTGRARQEELWADTNVNARQQLAAREAALRYKRRFQQTIAWFRAIEELIDMLDDPESLFCRRGFSIALLERIVEFAFPRQRTIVQPLGALQERKYQSAANSAVSESSSFEIMIRPRPLLPFEVANNEFPVVRTGTMVQDEHHKNSEGSIQKIVLHHGRIDRTGRRLQMTHYQYCFDRVFKMTADQCEVCDHTIKPLYAHAAKDGGGATLLLYGQTGTGKTYTLEGCIQWIADEILKDELDANVTFFEIHGKKCFDLLSNRRVVKLLSDKNEIVHPYNAKCIQVKKGQSMHDTLKEALKFRSITVTERNPVSSRSHAVLHIYFPGSKGTVKMVDLAGSERNYETIKMTPKCIAKVPTSIAHCLP